MTTKRRRPAGAPVRVDVVPIASLKALKRNPRQHGARDLDYLRGVLERVGAARSGVVDADGVVLAGNGFRQAAIAAGQRDAIIVESDGTRPVFVRRRGLTPEQRDEVIVADNRAAQLSTWETALLADYAARVPAIREGWTDKEWAAALAVVDLVKIEGRTDPDAVPARRATSIVVGDLFELGAHRLLCGDSTRLDEVERVLGAAHADLVFTDPPYGVNVSGKGGAPIAGDISFTAIPLMFDVLDKVLAPKAWCYVCGGQSNMALYARLFERYFRQLVRVVVWDKGKTAVLRRNGYHSCYEFVYFAFKEGGGGQWFGPRDSDHADDIWRISVEDGGDARVHVTQKPVAVPARAIGNSCPPAGLVFDPFGGSASTLIACEQLTRRCATMEIDPSYVQVAIDRWEAFSGGTAKKVGDARPQKVTRG